MFNFQIANGSLQTLESFWTPSSINRITKLNLGTSFSVTASPLHHFSVSTVFTVRLYSLLRVSREYLSICFENPPSPSKSYSNLPTHPADSCKLAILQSFVSVSAGSEIRRRLIQIFWGPEGSNSKNKGVKILGKTNRNQIIMAELPDRLSYRLLLIGYLREWFSICKMLRWLEDVLQLRRIFYALMSSSHISQEAGKNTA